MFTVDYSINASSGKLRSDSIITCNGVTYGQHSSDNHWHVAVKKSNGYYPDGEAFFTNPCNTNNITNNSQSEFSSNFSSNDSVENSSSSKNQETITSIQEMNKSDDNTLKTIILDGKNINVTDNITYITQKEKVIIEVTTNNEKATYEIKNNSSLAIGENKITVDVTAEDGTKKTYNIIIYREAILSSDTGIKIFIDNNEIIFNNYKANFNIDSSTEIINIDYTLNDEKAKVNIINKLDIILTGDNKLEIKVIAEDGKEQIYEITIHKNSKVEDAIYNLTFFGIFGIIGCGIYYLIPKIKEKRN